MTAKFDTAIGIPPSMDEVIASSFADFHVKGFDYLCLRRSPGLTVKFYFFDGDVSKMPEVVNPHDHRYPFHTTCLCGSLYNFIYHRDPDGPLRYNRFDYLTKLNGGDGFVWRDEERLATPDTSHYVAGEHHFMSHRGIHTIRLGENETVLRLLQYADAVPLGVPTSTYCPDKEPPSLSGLYNKFTPDRVRQRLRQLRERASLDIQLAGEPI